MTNRSPTLNELSIAVALALNRAEKCQQQLQGIPASKHQAHLHDHRAAVAGDMCETLNRLDPGMGDIWMQAMYPEIDLSGAMR